MRLVIRILFCFIVALGVIGFFVSQFENIPVAGKVLARSHYLASQCLKKLEESGSVGVQDSGFSELTTVTLRIAQKPPDLKVKKFQTKTEIKHVFNKHRPSRIEIPIEVILPDGTSFDVDLDALQKEVHKLYIPGVLLWTSLIFVVITLLQVTQFYLSEKETTRAKKISES